MSDWSEGAAVAIFVLLFLSGCRSDTPQPATAEVPSAGMRVTVTRVASHPFLARYNLTLRIDGPRGCRASMDLFPDTGGVSRRNLFQTHGGLLYVIGQYDARVIDMQSCAITLSEFRFLEPQRSFLGSFDEDKGRWMFLSPQQRPERPFEVLWIKSPDMPRWSVIGSDERVGQVAGLFSVQLSAHLRWPPTAFSLPSPRSRNHIVPSSRPTVNPRL